MLLLCKLSGCWQFALANILRSTEHLQGVGCSRQWPWPRSALSLVKESTPSSLIYIYIYTYQHNKAPLPEFRNIMWEAEIRGMGYRKSVLFSQTISYFFRGEIQIQQVLAEMLHRVCKSESPGCHQITISSLCRIFFKSTAKTSVNFSSAYTQEFQHARTGLLVRFPKAQKP